MSHDRNPARPKTRVGGSARDVFTKLRRKFTRHSRDVNANLFKHLSPHQRNYSATAFCTLPWNAFEPTGFAGILPLRGEFVLDSLKSGADIIAESCEPCSG